jgi:hypothetical protein|tara:strand:+ start:1675 stop:1845 length:171 start_codon:yes stop_codon:yes gene_type:complete
MVKKAKVSTVKEFGKTILETKVDNNRKEYLELIERLTEIVKAQDKILDKIKGRMGI